jgi:pyruvate dehydrogenase E2 component (dihydrolipoamide acetyltransferase)
MPEVVMPRLDPGMQSGKIVEWLKKEGESVQKGEPIVVVEGEKTTFEVEASTSGVLTKILVDVGSDVPVTQPIAVIGETSSASKSSAMIQPPTSPEGAALQTAGKPEAAVSERVIASPAARRLAQEHGVDISSLKGTGPGGRITREDILAAVEEAPTPSQVPIRPLQSAILRKSRLEGVRKTVAERLAFTARTAVPVILTIETDAAKLVTLKNRESGMSFTALAVKAAAKALEKHVVMNSTIDGDEITIYSDINIAVAINTEQGLMAPVIRHANRKSPKEINADLELLAQKAKANRLTVEDLTGGTFTVSNLGAQDVETFAPVINPPQCAILGLGRIGYRPVAVGERVSSSPRTTLTLVFDHRMVDGVPAARFLQEIKQNLEDPENLL